MAEPALSGGDVVRSVDGEKVKNLDEFIKTYEKITGSDKPAKSILVEFDRNGKNNVTLVKPKPKDEDDPPREVAKAWIGIDTQPVLKDLAEKLGNAKGLGFRVTRIYPKTQAAGSDLKVGDIIVGLNGEDVRPRGMQDAGMLARLGAQAARSASRPSLGVLRERAAGRGERGPGADADHRRTRPCTTRTAISKLVGAGTDVLRPRREPLERRRGRRDRLAGGAGRLGRAWAASAAAT